jgi:cytochrome d ubiquinol oxidase subunit II
VLADLPLAFILLGLTAYTVLGGADFGAGFWMLGSGHPDQAAIRDHARHSMGPVWEANHVWLIFVLVVCWTAYPVAFASIASTLTLPLFVAGVGIILRGAAYALRGQLEDAPHSRPVEIVFALSSVLTPFAMGAAVGGIASGRVPVGNAAGDLVTSWLNPTSILVGALGVATSAYLAAVYLAADARRMKDESLEGEFRSRALWAALAAGALALGGLLILRRDAPSLWNGLATGAGLVAVGVSGVAGLVTLVLVWRGTFGPARTSAALAVAAIIAGWAVAQRPYLLPGLTIDQAAAGRPTLIALVVSVAAGAIVLVPSLLLLFGLFLRGRFEAAPEGSAVAIEVAPRTERQRSRRLGTSAAAGLVAGVALTVGASGWVQAVGIVFLCGSAAVTFVVAAAAPDEYE